jgi:hypothetical protein
MAALLRTLTAAPAGRRLLLPALPATRAAAALTTQESGQAPRQGNAPQPEAEHARDVLHAMVALLRRLAEGGPRHAPPEAVGDYAASVCALLRCPACAPALAMLQQCHAPQAGQATAAQLQRLGGSCWQAARQTDLWRTRASAQRVRLRAMLHAQRARRDSGLACSGR